MLGWESKSYTRRHAIRRKATNSCLTFQAFSTVIWYYILVNWFHFFFIFKYIFIVITDCLWKGWNKEMKLFRGVPKLDIWLLSPILYSIINKTLSCHGDTQNNYHPSILNCGLYIQATPRPTIMNTMTWFRRWSIWKNKNTSVSKRGQIKI